MVVTVLEAVVLPEHVPDLQAAYAAATKGPLPAGLVRSHLLCAAGDGTRWRIESLWTNRGAVDSMRQSGTQIGVRVFRMAQAEAQLTVFDVAATIEPHSP
jgi:hypothetical protein